MTRPVVYVSDHAVLRYLERIGGIDVEHLRRQIALRCDQAARAGAIGLVIDGHTYVIAQGGSCPAVVTIKPTGGSCLGGDASR